jgi:hypothetical protein
LVIRLVCPAVLSVLDFQHFNVSVVPVARQWCRLPGGAARRRDQFPEPDALAAEGD